MGPEPDPQAVKQRLSQPEPHTGVPAHTPNWDLVSDVTTPVAVITAFSSKQCRNRRQNVPIPREKGAR